MNQQNSQTTLPANAAWRDFEGSGPAAHFYHANGFPLGMYTPLLQRLQSRFTLSALAMRPTWPGAGDPPRRKDWEIYATDLINFLDQQGSGPVVGIGHSMGAACTVLAAARRPDLFRSLILIEPVTASRGSALLLKLLPSAVVRRFEPIRSTLIRPTIWASREEYLEESRQHRAYRRFDDEALGAMRDHGVYEDADGRFRLAFPASWEAHNYLQPPWLLPRLKALRIPFIVVRTRPSVFCSEACWLEWQRTCPRMTAVEDPAYGHLLPIENATATEKLMIEGLHRAGKFDDNG